MGLRGLFFIGLFCIGIFATVFNPFWGILAYLGHYFLWPENQWWGKILSTAGIRVSLTIAVVTILAIIMHWGTLRRKIYGNVPHSQEILLWLYIVLVGISSAWEINIESAYELPVPPFSKMYKVGIFTLMMTYVVTTEKELKRLLYFMVAIGGTYLSWVALQAPAAELNQGRLENVGGPDLQDANFAATHFAGMGIITGILILINRSTTVQTSLLCCGALIANTVVLTRSRGAFLGIIAGGFTAIFLANSRIRKHLLWLLPLVAIGAYWVTDDLFWERIETIFVDADERDSSASSRIELWKTSIKIFEDYPMGVGAGKFFGVVGQYNSELADKDAHSTLFRTLAETGILGVTLLGALYLNGFYILARSKKLALQIPHAQDFAYIAFGLQVLLVTLFVSGLTITMSYTEESFIFLLLPVCCERALQHTYLQSSYPQLALY